MELTGQPAGPRDPPRRAEHRLAGLAAALARAPTGERPRFDTTAGALVGTRCAVCGSSAWPGRAVCHRCGSADVRECVFGRQGAMISCTQVWVPRPGLSTPYVLGQVRLSDGPVVFGLVTGWEDGASLPGEAGIEVEVMVQVDAERYWFEPVSR